MKYSVIIILMLSFAACAQTEVEPRVLKVSRYHSPVIDHAIAQNDPYQIDFDIEKSEEGEIFLVVVIEPKGGSFYVSPHSKQDFSGKFQVSLSENDFLDLGKEIEEIPRSVEVVDNHPFVGGPVNWVDVKTKYRYPLIINSKEDFVIGAQVRFTIEPKCTLEQTYFKIFHSKGEVKVEMGGC